MSLDTMLVVAAVISVFVAFAGLLIWGDFQTRPARHKAIVLPQKRRAF
jgi:membrane protein CcdC involved in cytochrome C biogenesis